jgi:hypothetical protein
LTTESFEERGAPDDTGCNHFCALRHAMAKQEPCAKHEGIFFLKIKSPTRLARPTRPTPKANCIAQSAYKNHPPKNQERKQTMKKKTKQATTEAAIEPIIANGIEFTPKMIEDLTKIAQIEASNKKEKHTADKLKGLYKLFLEENEVALRGDWVRVGNLRVRLEVSRTLKIEIID